MIIFGAAGGAISHTARRGRINRKDTTMKRNTDLKQIEAKIKRLKRAAMPFKNYCGKPIPPGKIRALAKAIVDLIREV